MKLQKILFSFDGRIGRRTYWLAIIALIAAVQLVTIGPFLLDNEMVAVMLIVTSQFIWLLSLWPILAVGSKRLHDRNKNGWWLLVFWLLPFVLFCGGFSIVLFDDPRTGRSGDFVTGSVLIFASLPPGLWGIVELGILPGTKGPNPYGDDPAQPMA
jgi:uncharacterized membrane protein YhaH (DUF805 family)